MNKTNLKPINRSKTRLFFGKKYYTYKKHVSWFKNRRHYVKDKAIDGESFLVFKHQTPLRRQLKDVDKVLDDNKIVNLKLAIKQVNQIVIHPGQVFSYWRLIGNPKAAKGYKEGMVLDHGKFKLGVGGGLCQLSNLLYWMVLHTPLEVLERHRHSYDVFPDSNRTQPFGSGATCVYNYRDFQFMNTTNESYQIKLYMDEHYLYGEVYSTTPNYLTYEIYEKTHSFSQATWGAYIRENKIHRSIKNLEGQVLDDHMVCENKAIMMYSPLLSPPEDFVKSIN